MTHETGTEGGLFVTTAKSIQKYVVANWLKEMVGASNIVKNISNRVLNKTIQNLKKHGKINNSWEVISQAAGGAILYFTDRDDAAELLKIWPLVTSQYAPGLEVVQLFIPCKRSEIHLKLGKEVDDVLRKCRQQPSVILPEASPLIVRNRRTASAAIEWAGGEPQDQELSRKIAEVKKSSKGLLQAIVPEEFISEINFGSERFPLDFNKIADKKSPYLAVIHIDGNGLGKLRLNLFEKLAKNAQKTGFDPIPPLQAFTQTVQQVTAAAAREGIMPIMEREKARNPVEPFYRFRPIVCSGDDLTLVTRAAEGLHFCIRFLEAFSEKAASFKDELCLENGELLTACAGIAFVKKGFPFALAYELSESLCAFAKNSTNRKFNAIGFHRVSASTTQGYDNILKEELTIAKKQLTMNPYIVASSGGQVPPELQPIDNLLSLASSRTDLPRSGQREIVQKLFEDQPKSEKLFDRMCTVQLEKSKKVTGTFLENMREMTGMEGHALWSEANFEEGIPIKTPFLDASELIVMDCFSQESSITKSGEEK